MSISFLLGSGISMKAGMPGTWAITQKVTRGRVWRATDSGYYLGNNPNPDIRDYDTRRVRKFMNILQTEIDSYYKGTPRDGAANYEDLYYLADQLRGSEYGHIDNPAVWALTQKLHPMVAPILKGNASFKPVQWSLGQLAHETCNLIRDVTWRTIIGHKVGKLDYLQFLADACLDDEQVDMFTLNHDTLTETFLASKLIQVLDGFGTQVNGIRYWEEGQLEHDTGHDVRFFKLHGSVNWFEFHQGILWRTGIPKDWDVWHTIGPDGKPQMPNGGRPKFLAGTGNKPLEYQAGLYVELHQLFHQWIRRSGRLAVIGYGFGDTGINQRIFEWLLTHDEARMVVVHHNPTSLKAKARWNLEDFWPLLEGADKIKFIPKRAEEVSWVEIKELPNALP